MSTLTTPGLADAITETSFDFVTGGTSVLKITYNIETLVDQHACQSTIDENFKATIFLDENETIDASTIGGSTPAGTSYEEFDLFRLTDADFYRNFISFDRPAVYT